MPDADDLAFEAVLAAKGAGVGGVLRHLHLLHRLPERRTIARRVLASDANFLRAFRHFDSLILSPKNVFNWWFCRKK